MTFLSSTNKSTLKALPPPPSSTRRESRAELQQALLNWAGWHAQRYLAGYVPPSVASGRLAVEPAQLLGGGTDGAGTGGWAMEDVPAAPAALPSNFNVAYEQVKCSCGWCSEIKTELPLNHKEVWS